MSELISHNCGLAVTHSLHDAYTFIKSLQHRGREAAGIAAVSDNSIDVIKWLGTVERFDLVSLHEIFSNDYHTFLSHVRYATSGRKDKLLDDAHPHVIGGEIQKYSTHVIIRNCLVAGVHNGQVNEEYLKDVDRSKLLTECDTEALLHFYNVYGPHQLIKKIPGAFTIAVADKRIKGVLVMRDGKGLRPGVVGFKDGKYCAASEDIAVRKNCGDFIEEIEAGHIYYFDPAGSYSKEKVVEACLASCFFEYNYVSDKDSIIQGVSVRKVRELLGEKLAEEFNPPECDFVTFVPRCPEVAAVSYSSKINKPLKKIFYKIRSERSFQGSTVDERKQSIESNLYILPSIRGSLSGKKIVVIDDSIVRGNVIKRAVNLLKEEGVSDIFFASYTPPIGIIGKDGSPRGCLFGVDMPPDDSFIARNKSLEQISKEVDANVSYLSLESMLEVYDKMGIQRNSLCTFCVGGKHPFC